MRGPRRSALAAILLLAPAAPGTAPSAAFAADAAVASVGLVDAVPAGPSVEQRLAEIRRRIQEALVYPALARRRGLEGVTRVRFEIGVDGRAQGVGVERSSGHAILDRAARRCVVDAGVLPRVYGQLEVPVLFDLRRRR